MQRIANPLQSRLFDPFDPVLTEKTRTRLLDDWPGVFRHVILELMPVGVQLLIPHNFFCNSDIGSSWMKVITYFK